MKKFFAILVILAVVLILFGGCTEQQRAKQFGGSATIDLPPGKKLVVATWKDDNLWFLTRDMEMGEKAETYTFAESSSWGMMEGVITIKEHK